MTVKQAVISDAGVSSRFLPIVKTIPKSMLPIGNKPVIQLLVEECIEAQIDNIIIVCREDNIQYFEDYFNNKREDLESFLVEMKKPERYDSVRDILNFPKIKFIVQDPILPYGTAAPIMSAKPYLIENEPFIFLQGDDLVLAGKKDCEVLIEEYELHKGDYQVFIIAQEVTPDRVHLYGSIKFKEGTTDELDYIVEKPKYEDAPSLLVSYGRFLYEYKIFDYMKPEKLGVGGEFWNVDVITDLAKDYKVKVVKNRGRWVTTGDPYHYLKSQILFGLNDKEFSDQLSEFLKTLKY